MANALPNALLVDRAVGDLKLDGQAGPQLATYVRYNVLLEHDWLKTELGVELAPDKIEQIHKMDDPSNMADLAELGSPRRNKSRPSICRWPSTCLKRRLERRAEREPMPHMSPEPPCKVALFSGHMIDGPWRQEPGFHPNEELDRRAGNRSSS